MALPGDADARVSEELSIVLEALSSEPSAEAPLTLGVARERVRQMIASGQRSPDHRIGSEQTVAAELDALIEEFGEQVRADGFIVVRASAALSAVIEAVIDRSDEDTAVTLAAARSALAAGFAAVQAGRGALEPDEEMALRAELDALIERYGPDTPAEILLRFD